MTLPKSAITSATGSIVSTGVEVERRHAPQRHLGDARRARRARPAPRAAVRDRCASSARTTEPSPVTSSSPTIVVARLPSAAPVPCVAVDVAPAIDCWSMSPRFGIARPCPSELCVEVAEPDARLHGHVGAVDARASGRIASSETRCAVGHRRIGERVAAADRLHALAGLRGLTDDRRDLVGLRRLVHRGGHASLVPRPVPRADSHRPQRRSRVRERSGVRASTSTRADPSSLDGGGVVHRQAHAASGDRDARRRSVPNRRSSARSGCGVPSELGHRSTAVGPSGWALTRP